MRCGCGVHVQVELAEEKSVRKAGEYQSRQTVEDLTTDVEVGLSEYSPPLSPPRHPHTQAFRAPA